jgi:hypothetical protein
LRKYIGNQSNHEGAEAEVPMHMQWQHRQRKADGQASIETAAMIGSSVATTEATTGSRGATTETPACAASSAGSDPAKLCSHSLQSYS